jgi:UDP-N-acetylglucosamine acyltransferase
VSIHPTAQVHPTSIVSDSAVIGAGVIMGPFCTVGPDVILGENCELVSHVVVDGRTKIGAGCRIFSSAAVGVAPQDLKYKGEPTALEVGERTVIRECATISRGTPGGGGVTRVGSDCLIMAYAHVGHDSQIGHHCILANGCALAGHVTIEDYATVGALCPVHQFCRIGRHAYIGGGTTITQDVLPFSLTSAERQTHAFSLNKVGLERRGFAKDELRELHRAFRVLLAAGLNTSQAIERLKSGPAPGESLQYLIEFIEASSRGVIK